MARGPCDGGLHLNFGVPMAIASRMPRKPARPVVLGPPAARDPSYHFLPDVPFMNDMDEISYWIHTKRAPCLMNYDNVIKKQSEEAHCSKIDKQATETDLSPRKKKKKRKLSLLEDSVSSGKQQNIYFDGPQQNPVVNNCKSDSLGSEIDFNVKNTSVGDKPKKIRLQKNNRTRLHTKNKLLTSTPKTYINLRRSLRQAQLNNSHLNSSFEIFNTNGALVKHKVNQGPKTVENINKSENLAGGDQTTNNKSHNSRGNKPKHTLVNGMFEDLSDVSGFTANYIRSTKVQSNKKLRNLRCKTARILTKESQQTSQANNNMIVCVNKSMNTGLPEPNILNCSTDSSQNVINLVTSKNSVSPIKLDKSTSLLKFMDTKVKIKETASKSEGRKGKANLNISFQSQSSGTSRYPKRQRIVKETNNTDINQTSASARRKSNKNCLEFNNSDKKENPEDKLISRRRSGRSAVLSSQQRKNSVLVVSNSTEQVSSMVSLSVASPPANQKKKRLSAQSRQLRTKKSASKSLRDKSGFTACFSESDDDSVPLMQRKYFCN